MTTLGGIVAAIAIAAAQPSTAEAPHATEETPQSPLPPDARLPPVGFVRGFHGLASLSFGGTPAAASSTYVSAAAATSLTLRPRFGFSVREVDLVAGADLGGAYELASGSETGAWASWSDLYLSLGAPGVLRTPDARFAFTPVLYATAPLNDVSFSPLTRVGAQVGGEFIESWIRAGLFVSGERHVWLPPAAGSSLTTEQNNGIYICRTDAGACGLRGPVTDGALRADAQVEARIRGPFSVGGELGLERVFVQRAVITEDPYGSSKTDVNGKPVTVAAASSDLTRARIFVTWRIHRFGGLTAWAASEGSPRTADARFLRLPFGAASTWVGLSMFVRTDEVLEPAWLP